MSKRNLSGSIALTKLKHVIMEKKGKSGMVKGLFIPIDVNYLKTDKNGALYININVVVNDEANEYKQHGFISQQGNKKWGDCSDEEKETFKKLPYLGNLKDFSGDRTANDNSGAASTEQFSADGDDDLPF